MKANLIAAAILAVGLIIGGFMSGGRYQIVHVQGNELARLDRFTGEVLKCMNDDGGLPCGFTVDKPARTNSN